MLSEISLRNFKCFSRHTIPLRAITVIVGRNNAGKSTIVEALRLVSLVASRLEFLPFLNVPRWLDIPRVNVGVSPSLSNQELDFESVFHSYNDPPAEISARYESGAVITIYIGGPERVHAVVRDPRRHIVVNKGRAKFLRLEKIGILPPIGPLVPRETVLVPEYVRKSMSSTLASLHFRNELNLLYDEAFATFKEISEATWHGLEIQDLIGRGRRHETELRLLVRNEEFVGEVNLMGHGLQMWLQTMWFLSRCRGFETVILDEPDVYMHADLQRKLMRFLRGRHPQVILATHSIEIMSEVDPEAILVVDREKRQAQFTTDVPEMQRVVDQIGGVHNLQLAKLWGARRCLFVEGKDLALLKHFQNRLFPSTVEPIDAIPNLSVGGWGGWQYAVGSSMLLRGSVSREITSYCFFDSDFHTPSQIAERRAEAHRNGLNLHIWSRKELENYLLVPQAIHRVIGGRAGDERPLPTVDLIREKLFELAGGLKDEVMDALAAELLAQNKPGGPTQANRAARERMAPLWDTLDGRLSIASGKVILAKLSEWLQQDYGVSMSAAAVARVLRRNEIAHEVVQVLSAIEDGEPFPDGMTE